MPRAVPMNLLHRSLRASILTLAATGALAVLLLCLGGTWLHRQMSGSADTAFVAKDVVADILPPPLYLIELRLLLSQALEGQIDVAQAETELQRLTHEFEARSAHWRTQSPEDLAPLLLGEQHAQGEALIRSAREAVLPALRRGDLPAAQRALTQAHGHYLAHRAAVNRTVVAAQQRADAAAAALRERGRLVPLASLAATLAVLLLLAQLARQTLQSVLQPVQRCAQAAQRLAHGDLQHATPARHLQRQDEIGELERSFEAMRQGLLALLGRVQRGADEVAAAAQQIAQGNTDLSQRTQQEAGAVGQTHLTIVDLSQALQANIAQSEQATQIAGQATAVARQGGEEVGGVVSTMQDIADSSRRIAEIIAVIDGIAFQTTLLALNASVEAARAGEQGRGFAVVAGEVRGLAGRTTRAAREIKALIDSSVARVERGNQQVATAGATMQRVVAGIGQVEALIAEISRASREQGDGATHVHDAVQEIGQSIQLNAAMVEQVAGAATQLHAQAHELVAAAAQFRLPAAAPVAPGLAPA